MTWIDYFGVEHNYINQGDEETQEGWIDIYFPVEGEWFNFEGYQNFGEHCKWATIALNIKRTETEDLAADAYISCIEIDYAPFDKDLLSELMIIIEDYDEMAVDIAKILHSGYSELEEVFETAAKV